MTSRCRHVQLAALHLDLLQQTHLLHGTHNNYSCLDGQRRCSHGYSCRGDGHRDRLTLLAGMLTGLDECVLGNLGGRGRESRGRLGRQSEVEEGEGDRLLLHPYSLPTVLLLTGDAVLHLDTRMDRLVAPQVVAILELLVAGGTDVAGPARYGERFDWQT